MRPKYVFRLPVYADSICPDVFADKSLKEISELKLWEGNKQRTIGELFDVQGTPFDPDEDAVIRLVGDLQKVRTVGCNMSFGKLLIEGDIGMRLGEGMKGGEIIVKGNVDSWVGCMMEDGKIEIHGSAGDYVAAPYRGSTEGMKNGVIVIHGDAGNEVGCYMRNGMISIEGNVGEFVGIHMRDGTILVRGNCGGRTGAGMLDGKIIICGRVSSVLPTFTIDSVKSSVKADGEKIKGPFYRFTGDIADQGKGKLYISKPLNPHLSFYEKYLQHESFRG